MCVDISKATMSRSLQHMKFQKESTTSSMERKFDQGRDPLYSNINICFGPSKSKCGQFRGRCGGGQYASTHSQVVLEGDRGHSGGALTQSLFLQFQLLRN